MGIRIRKNKGLAVLLAVLVALSIYTPPMAQDAEAAAETALSERKWADVEPVLQQKFGQSYAAVGQCTGFVYWGLKNAYGMDLGTNSTVDGLETKLKKRGVTAIASGTGAALPAAAKPGDIVIFKYGGAGSHCGFLGSGGKLYHAQLSNGVNNRMTFSEWMRLPDASKNCDSYVLYRGLQQNITVNIVINKASANPVFSEGNACYSLAGARYGVYSGSTLLATLTTNGSGTASGTVTVAPEVARSITVREIAPSPGFGLDDAAYTRDGSGGRIVITSKEPPIGNPVDALLYKSDGETGKYAENDGGKRYVPQKGGSLAGAVFKVSFYGIKEADMPEDGDYSRLTPLRTWHVETDEEGRVGLAPEYLAEGYDQDDFYRDHGSGDIALPLGVVTMQEIKAPEGYLLNDRLYPAAITPDGGRVRVHTYQEPVVPNQIKRGDLTFTKAEGSSLRRMAGIPFLITALEEDGRPAEDGESHVIVTDANGYASTANSFNPHGNRTNANDAAWDGTQLQEEKLDPEAGIWFGEASAIRDGKGALPYGTYRIDELPCKGNREHALLKGILLQVSRDSHVISLGTFTNHRIILRTSLWDGDLQERRVTLAREDMTLTDRIICEGLEKGAEYTLRGVLMDKATGKPLLIEGKEVAEELVFTATGSKTTVDMDFHFDGSGLRGKDIVAFETLLKDGSVVAVHEDIDDLDQTIRFLNPNIETDARDSETENRYSVADSGVTIIDEVRYEGLLRGYTYEMTAWLMDREKGEPLKIDGREVRTAKEFTPNRSDGALSMELTFDARELAGEDVVVFEEITWEGMVVGEHKDLKETRQTVSFEGKKSAGPIKTGDSWPPGLVLAMAAMMLAAAAGIFFCGRKLKGR